MSFDYLSKWKVQIEDELQNLFAAVIYNICIK